VPRNPHVPHRLSVAGAAAALKAQRSRQLGSSVTKQVYRHQLRPVLDDGATAMDAIFPFAER
jgi:hypothetical protein